MKKIIYSLVIMIAASSLFTACIEQIEPKGIENLRDAKAEYLKNVGQLRLAEAEVQKAQATYWQALAAVEQANAAYRDAQTEGQKLLNEMQALLNEAQEMTNESQKLDLEQKAAQIAANIETIRANAEIAAVQAQQNLATAQENLRVALAKIAADQLKLTDAEAAAVSSAVLKYEYYLNQYFEAVEALTAAEKAVWNHEYDMAARGMGGYYEYMIEYYTEMAEVYKEMAENVPEDADVEAWSAELKKYQDSLEEYKYNRYQVTKDSVEFMVNVYHDGAPAYEEAYKEWVKASPFKGQTAAQISAFDPTKAPKLEDYIAPADTLNLPPFVYDPAEHGSAEYVYKKYADLLGKYTNIENPYSKMSSKTKIATVKNEDGIQTVNVLAGQALKGFVLGAPEATDITCKVKIGNDEYNLEAQYGMKGALSTIKRDLVLLETEPDEKVKENYEKAKALWEADRDTLLKGRDAYEPIVDAIADTLAAYEALEAAKKEYGSGCNAMVTAIETFVNALHDAYAGGGRYSVLDSAHIYSALRDFAAARERFLDYTPVLIDSNYFRYGYRTTAPHYDSVEFSKLVYNNFRPTNDFPRGLYSMVAGDPGWCTGSSFGYVSDQLFGYTMWPYVVGNMRIPTDKEAVVYIMNNEDDSDNLYAAFYGIYKLGVDVDDNYVITMANGDPYVSKAIEEAEEALEEAREALDAAKVAYGEVYKRYWGEELPAEAEAEDEYNVKIYTYETFTEPYNVVTFTGKKINYSDALGSILASVDAKDGFYGKDSQKTQQQDWGANNYQNICESVTFGKNDGEVENFTDFGKYMYYKAQYEALTNWQAFQEAVERIEAWVEECEAAFDEQVEKAAEDGQKKYDKDAASFDKKVAAYKELTGSSKKDAKVFDKIDVPTDYAVAQIAGGEWVMGGKQAEWADEFLPEYPAKLAEWKKAADKCNDQITHLETLINTLDAAYIAAVKVYDTETTAATFKKYVEDYGAYRANYYNTCVAFYNYALGQVEFFTKQLAQFNAGFDATQLAYEDALHAVALAQQVVDDALAQLKIAEAEYNKVMAEYCPAE